MHALFDRLSESGVSLAAAAPLTPPPEWDLYLRWLEGGYHAGMIYLSEPRLLARRADPRLLFPHARSIVMAALPIPAPASLPTPPQDRPRGRLASYAWGMDYHLIIPALLRQAADSAGLAVYAASDSAPILERGYAVRAGLGWIGRNTCLIHPVEGSFFLLGVLLVDAELEQAAPFAVDRCGTCDRCVRACPTGCIRADRTLDSGRCISYLTIENKGAIPRDLRPALGHWVFGCDICQQVCPWNHRRLAQSGHPALAPTAEIPFPVLENELTLTPQEFKQRFTSSPVLRAKRRGYLRSVCVALGNSTDRSSVPALAECLASEPEPLVRAHAAWALARLGGPPASAALDRAMRDDPDPQVRQEARERD